MLMLQDTYTPVSPQIRHKSLGVVMDAVPRGSLANERGEAGVVSPNQHAGDWYVLW